MCSKKRACWFGVIMRHVLLEVDLTRGGGQLMSGVQHNGLVVGLDGRLDNTHDTVKQLVRQTHRLDQERCHRELAVCMTTCVKPVRSTTALYDN